MFCYYISIAISRVSSKIPISLPDKKARKMKTFERVELPHTEQCRNDVERNVIR